MLAAVGGVGLALSARPLARLAASSGVTAEDICALLPGDDLVTEPSIVIDRAVILQAHPSTIWPWILQLGKGRGGWYFPPWIEGRLIPEGRRGLRRIDQHWQRLRLGDTVSDWGPGEPEMRVAVLQPEHALVYLSLRDRDDHWRWPVGTGRGRVLAMSWALVLRPLGDQTRLHLRLRVRTTGPAWSGRVTGFVGGLIDWITVRWLFSGLATRVAESRRPAYPSS
jgi:hypothetical protein